MIREMRRIAAVALAMFLTLFVSSSVIQVGVAESLYADGRNTRTLFDSYRAERGSIIAGGSVIAESVPSDDDYRFQRVYRNPYVWAPVSGYFTLNQGLSGIEAAMNGYLSGTSGSQFLQQLRSLFTGERVRGANVNLSLDPIIQQAAYDALAESGFAGAVIVTEPATGRVLAMVSTPSYDPQPLASQDTDEVIEVYDALLGDAGDPLINRAIAGDMNPPGSTFKLVVMAAALESGKWTADSELPNPLEFQLPGSDNVVRNSGGGTCGPGETVTIREALRISCNIPFAELGIQLGRKALLDQAKRFGFNSGFEIPLVVEASYFPPVMDEPQTALSAFGQFDVRATPLQIAMVTAAIANGGIVMLPNMVDSVVASDGQTLTAPTPVEYQRAMSAETAATIAAIMVEGVSNGAATNAKIEGVTVAGKTGTAENGEGEPYTLWFTGFAPAEAPRYAITVLVEDGGGLGQQGYGNLIAAPIARRVLEAVLFQ
jgi:peptidoglycan glycosyltransferase